ncbi:type II toxin-antitoxin system ParD family antitoxin [Calothrix sp. PCC 7507]|uniref:type II toxin-antitoxin system ParD family antitoxin n=1 Tax=Calothrix sp. PCC 7507 TaxID=99598 RepID=UPI00029EFD91|nr:type II toxin-antitoxin system ParD family antitoxin [Calothrix sp. PCC 7507]AFY32244.1 addiction module antidote protein, CC2985 family [Calothrix sp. PCC 7507]
MSEQSYTYVKAKTKTIALSMSSTKISAIARLYNKNIEKHLLKFGLMSISLTPELEQFIQSQISSGKYASTEEVILAGIKLLEERERIYQGRFEELKREIALGVEQLERGERLDGRAVIEKLRQKNQVMRKAEA